MRGNVALSLRSGYRDGSRSWATGHLQDAGHDTQEKQHPEDCSSATDMQGAVHFGPVYHALHGWLT